MYPQDSDISPGAPPRTLPRQQHCIGHHKKMFLTFSQDERLPPVAQALCQQFVDFKETRFATPSLATPWGNHNPEEWTHQRSKLYLTWASLNVRSIYGREKTLTELMQQNQISVLALQETFERVNDPPEGLPRSTYSKPGDNARR